MPTPGTSSTSSHARSVGGLSNVRIAYLAMRRPLRVRRNERGLGRVIELLLTSSSFFNGIIWADLGKVDPRFGPFAQYVVFSPDQVLPPFEEDLLAISRGDDVAGRR